jgi:hypothetical protein
MFGVPRELGAGAGAAPEVEGVVEDSECEPVGGGVDAVLGLLARFLGFVVALVPRAGTAGGGGSLTSLSALISSSRGNFVFALFAGRSVVVFERASGGFFERGSAAVFERGLFIGVKDITGDEGVLWC